MSRTKKKPKRSVGGFGNGSTCNSDENSVNPKSDVVKYTNDDGKIQDIPLFVDVDKSSWDLMEHKDLSEIVLSNLNSSPEFIGCVLNEEFFLRIRSCNVNEHVGRMKLGRWPVLSAENIYLEFINKRVIDKAKACDVVCGQFDGSDDGVTGLVHLVSLKYLTPRQVFGALRIRVEMLHIAFEASISLLDNTRQVWKKSMMNVMGWLRPELNTSEARYGVYISSEMEEVSNLEVDNDSCESSKFDVGKFYEAIKRSKFDRTISTYMLYA